MLPDSYFAQVASAAVLLEDVVIVGGLNDICHSNDVGVLQRFVDRNFEPNAAGGILVGLHWMESRVLFSLSMILTAKRVLECSSWAL